MYPGLAESDCWMADLHYRELVAEGQYQQRVGGIRPTSIDTRPMLAEIRQQLGTLLVQAGQRLQGAHAITRDSLVPVAARKRGSVA